MKTLCLPSALAFALVLSIAPLCAWAPADDDTSLRSVPENWEARTRLRETIFAPASEAAAARARIVPQAEEGDDVSFRAEVHDGAVYLVFANRNGNAFPLVHAGTYIIKRSLRDGSFLQAKIFIQDDPGCYLRLTPSDDRTAMDIVLYNESYQTHVILPVQFGDLLTSSFSRVVALSKSSVNWSLVVSPSQGPGDGRVEQVVHTLRERLGTLRDMDDGAMDASGRLVFIATGKPAPPNLGGFNCSGFAKWVIDGFYFPLTGSLTNIDELRSRDSDFLGKAWTARFEEEQDPYFGLDWTRGLARALAEARTGRLPGPDALDVTREDRFDHVKDVGYRIENLQPLLYFLARGQPGMIYLGSVNARSKGAPEGSSLLLRQHHHVVVLLPYFGNDGDFHPIVMERNKETSVASLIRRYPGQYINLVKVDSTGRFDPPELRQ
ncbi:MAG TPA: hypothetical protein VL354_17480 [Spirochaetia bacterium]|nr:hypothetical protein [Spirochaetia bacterium]